MGVTNDEYAVFLSNQGYSHFFTLTTEYPLSLKSARRLSERTFSNWRKLLPNLSGFWVAERFKEKEGYHIHGLISLPKTWKLKSDYVSLLDGFQRATGMMKEGKWQRVDLRRIKRRSSDAHEYVAKYVSKSMNVDYDFVIQQVIDGQLKLEL